MKYYKLIRGGVMNHYNQSYTKEAIELVLKKIKSCIRNDRFFISLNENRKENINFINEYNVHSTKQKNILLQLKTEDFCHTLQNTKVGFEYEVLYVFVPQVQLFNINGEMELVDIYTKFNIIDLPNGVKTIVISFHKRNKPIQYLFR